MVGLNMPSQIVLPVTFKGTVRALDLISIMLGFNVTLQLILPFGCKSTPFTIERCIAMLGSNVSIKIFLFIKDCRAKLAGECHL